MQNKYPLWKYVLLIVITLVSFVYALPNLYAEDPSIQISGKGGQKELESEIASVLKKNTIPYKSISQDGKTLLIRFNSTDVQLKAQDLIKSALGTDYTVALNLAPSTPTWLSALGAEPMKQGLDLRGGIHFLLEVDVKSVIDRRLDGTLKNIAQELRQQRIRYSGLKVKNRELSIRFRNEQSVAGALEVLRGKIPNVVLAKKSGSFEIVGSITPEELNKIRQTTIEQTMSILRNRVNELGVGEAVVQQQGANRIAVDLPGIQDAARAKQILGGTATLEFHIVDSSHDPSIAEQTGVVPVGTKLYMMNNQPLLLKRQVVLSGDSITSAMSSYDQQSASPSVNIQLGGGGEGLFSRVTRANIGKRMAIVFVETKTIIKTVNGKKVRQTKKTERVISAPVIQSALGSNFQITGLGSSQEATNLALLLRAGALPAAIYPVEERTVGPSLGKENVRRGIISLEVGMALILVTMLFYYRLFGLIANVALFLNLVLLVALLSVIDATLTLPGIAGIVLTVGMAVDANVLIYERIREELRHGMTPQAAIFAGYERAFSTIIDANVTTLIVAVVLFAIGTGAVKGFAVTLIIGLITSMLTGITFTRAMVNLIYGQRSVKRLSIGI